MNDHKQSPEEAQTAEGEVFIIHLSQNKTGDGEEEQTEKADEHKQQHHRQRGKEELHILAVAVGKRHAEAVRQLRLRRVVGIGDLDRVFLFGVEIMLRDIVFELVHIVTGRVRHPDLQTLLREGIANEVVQVAVFFLDRFLAVRLHHLVVDIFGGEKLVSDHRIPLIVINRIPDILRRNGQIGD